MTVQQLIDVLNNMNPNAEVQVDITDINEWNNKVYHVVEKKDVVTIQAVNDPDMETH